MKTAQKIIPKFCILKANGYLVDFPPFFDKGDNYTMTSCFLSCIQPPSEKGSTLRGVTLSRVITHVKIKRKLIIFFKCCPFFRRKPNNSDRVITLESVSILFDIYPDPWPLTTPFPKLFGKYPKNSNTIIHTILAKILLFKQLFLKILSEMANSVDPDQTAPQGAVWSGSALFAYAILSEAILCALFAYAILSTTLVYKILGQLLSFCSHLKIARFVTNSIDPI